MMLGEYFKGIFSRKESVKTGKFLLGFAVSFFVLNAFFLLVPLELVELFFAQVSLFFLNIFGFAGEIVFGEPVLIQLESVSQPIGISYLCTGILETVIIVSAVVSSFGIGTKKRLLGVVTALLAVVSFNVARIVASILIIIFFGLDVAGFSHDVLFRVFLFASIAGFYYYWFLWAVKGKQHK